MQDLEQALDSRYDRVRDHSPIHVNRRIALTTQANLERCIYRGHDAVVHRLSELDREWDVDRVLMANFAILGGAAYALGVKRYREDAPFRRKGRGLLTLFGVQLGFLLMHAMVGWCPPVSLWRRLGFRSRMEIDTERSLLLAALDGIRAAREEHQHALTAQRSTMPRDVLSEGAE